MSVIKVVRRAFLPTRVKSTIMHPVSSFARSIQPRAAPHLKTSLTAIPFGLRPFGEFAHRHLAASFARAFRGTMLRQARFDQLVVHSSLIDQFLAFAFFDFEEAVSLLLRSLRPRPAPDRRQCFLTTSPSSIGPRSFTVCQTA